MASNPLLRSLAYPTPSALTPSALWCRQPLGMPCGCLFLNIPFVDTCKWRLMGLIVSVRFWPSACVLLWVLFLSTSVTPYSIFSSLFRLTGYGVKFLLTDYYYILFFRGVERSFTGNSLSYRTYNALDKWCVLIGSTSDEGVASSSAHFCSIYIWRLLLILPISSLLIFERESPSPLISSTRPLLPSACSSLPLRPFFFRKLTYQYVPFPLLLFFCRIFAYGWIIP